MKRKKLVVGERVLIDTQDDTCWVNSLQKMLGRFGLHAFEVVYEDSRTQGIWYNQRPDTTTRADWELFQQQMREVHKIWVPDEMMPARLNGTVPSEGHQGWPAA
jgi:hypothetical protein